MVDDMCVCGCVCVSGPSNTERARSTNEEPRNCPVPGNGRDFGRELCEGVEHWLNVIRVEELTSEPDPASIQGWI